MYVPGFIYSKWKMVYVILSERKFKIYEEKGDDQITACLNFDHFMHCLEPDKNDYLLFTV